MPVTLFLQSAVTNPYALYEKMLKDHPVYWDEINQLWAVYSYEACLSVLTNTAAHIPSINQNNKEGLNEYAMLLTHQLARLSNEHQHTIAREVALLLFQKIKTISISDIVEELLQGQHNAERADWVNTICKKLPVLAILKSFSFKDGDADFIACRMDHLVKIMLAGKSIEQVKQINEISKEIYGITEKQLLATGIHHSIIQSFHEKYKMEPGKVMEACVSNLIGLFIQGYDAGRGLLSNALLQILNNNKMKPVLPDKAFIEKSVIETLRFDPPVQNTRRVAVENIIINTAEIKKGQSVLLVLAAANRDPKKFIHPNIYDTKRTNNSEHLTFGAGHHVCVAKHFSVYLATETLLYFFERYKNIKLLENTIQYEPVINVRLPKEMRIAFS